MKICIHFTDMVYTLFMFAHQQKEKIIMFSDFVSFCILIKHYKIRHVVYHS